MTAACNIVWFRRDLRISDNEIVSLATASSLPTLFIFVIDPWFFAQAEIGAMRVKFLIESLIALDDNLQKHGAKLTILSGESAAVIQKLLHHCQSNGVQPNLYFNQDIQVEYGLQRDAAIRNYCQQHNVPLHEGRAYFLQNTNADQADWHKQYYAYQAAKQWHVPKSIAPFMPDWLQAFDQIMPSALLQWVSEFVSNIQASSLFNGGEVMAQQTLITFLTERYHGYHWKLSRPYLAEHGATSQLSPHIAFGTISTRQVTAAATKLRRRLARDKPSEVRTVDAFLSRVRWRDSFTQRLLLFPELLWKNRFAEFDNFYSDEPLTGRQADYFAAWQTGQTGFPLLDASMRQLAQDGWLNFRTRAQAVTMLCIIFGVSWHHGARYFMQQLVDGDVAINHWQWQMQAGITNPLSPSFRIYSPDKNLRERDPQLQYIHQWLPEYKGCATIDAVLNQADPIVDFAAAKQVNGARISSLRRQVRDRILREGGNELAEAVHMHRRTSQLDAQAKSSKPTKPKSKTLPGQLSLFEAGNG